MKIKIEVSPDMDYNEVVIRCPDISEEVQQVQKLLADFISRKNIIVFYKGEKEFYFPIQKVLFFETNGNTINAHTADDVFDVKYKLYELEEMVPAFFLRVSKSTILNIKEIYSITKNITASSVVEFQKSCKKVYVSRNYYKSLKNMMSDRI